MVVEQNIQHICGSIKSIGCLSHSHVLDKFLLNDRRCSLHWTSVGGMFKVQWNKVNIRETLFTCELMRTVDLSCIHAVSLFPTN